MPRRERPARREIESDQKYNSVMVARFVNCLMRVGKKSLATRTLYDSFDIMEGRIHRNPLEVFEEAVKRSMPLLEVKPRRVGGATYQVPVEVSPSRAASLAMRWLIESAHARPGKSMAEKLAGELMDASQGLGATIKRREDTHRMAEANRAFAHYRW